MTRTGWAKASEPDVDSDRLDDDGAPTLVGRHRPSNEVRLVWAPPAAANRLAGAWWPRTWDATTELRVLLPAVTDRLGGPATRASLNIDAWDADQPDRLRIGETMVRLGWFHTLDPATITCRRYGQERLTLAIIPHDANATAAQSLLDRLSTAAYWADSTSELLKPVCSVAVASLRADRPRDVTAGPCRSRC